MTTASLTIPRRKLKAKATRRGLKLDRVITVCMGCGIPLLSLSLSNLGGRLLTGGPAILGVLALVLCVSVLAVSLSHLAWAIAHITRSSPFSSWCLAITVDISLVLSELVGVFGGNSNVEALRLGLVVSVTGASMVLNVWAFLRNR